MHCVSQVVDFICDAPQTLNLVNQKAGDTGVE
jgi:hypothetical protein